MDGKKTSAEQAREQAEQATLGSMLDGAFGAMDGIEGPPEPETQSPEPEETETPDQTAPLNISTTESGPTGPPTGPPSDPPSEAPGPTGPPTGPPSGPPSEAPGPVEEVVTKESTPEVLVEQPAVESEPASEPNHEHTPIVEEPTDLPEEVPEPVTTETDEPQPMEQPVEEIEQVSSSIEEPANQEEIARLTAEIERLRSGLVGAAEVIEELEETPMPPIVFDNIVVAPHLVADFARMGRQLNQANLVKGSMGSMSMLHPDEPGLMISTRHSTSLARLDERGIVGGRLGGTPPRGSIADWKVHEVLLASVSVVTGGPAAAIHMHGPYTTAASCEKDLIIVQPIDVIGKEQIGKVVIVDPDGMDTEFLRQVAEALNQGGLRCVVVRGHGAYAVGANLDQAMANAAMLEHSMQILLLARQANLKF